VRSQCAAYVKQHAGRGACFQVQSVLAKLSLCRTRALGGQTYQCDDCGEVTEVFHSCGDRNCPQCSGCKRYDFAARAEQLILEGVTYYQVVFTLPGQLSELALANREAMADLLFESAGASLRKTIRSEQDYDPASMMVLHTWNQQLQSHWHVHALVPGGGPSLSQDQWKSAQSPPGALNSDDFYLVDAISLREAFRKAAMSRLRRLYAKGKLKLGGKFEYLKDESAWTKFCDELTELDWVSFIQPPPTKSSTAEQVVRYLTRYLTGGPISDSRIIAADLHHVTFLAREGKRVGGDREQVPVTITTMDFMRRWCEHIQPDQLTKTRYFGGWCSLKRTKYQATCRRLLSQELAGAIDTDSPDTLPLSSLAEESVERESQSRCPGCDGHSLRLVSQTPKPEWSSVLTHLDSRCPAWYAETEYVEFCAYLEYEYGISYEDWDLETRIESTMTDRPPTPARQLYLPGLCPESGYLIDSF
jgi:predicted nucleic acid-binding Zn ribbon protein